MDTLIKQMKQIFDSKDTFTAYATIDAGYYTIRQIQNKILDAQKRTPIQKMVDDATGYSKAKSDEYANEIIHILEEIIEAKKVIEADYSEDIKSIIEITKLITNP